ncbi:MAG: EpsG family protein [Thermoguttaceae bacterium]|nr:EpsG family protein [Thermoguttaceae bacterium]
MEFNGLYYCITLVAAVCLWGLLTYRRGGFAFYGPIFVLLVFFSGARDYWVGTDSSTYVRRYESFRGFEEVVEDLTETESGKIGVKSMFSEWGFSLLQTIAQLISDEYWALFTLVAIVCVGCHLLSFHQYSENVLISLYVLLTMTWYFFFFNGIRQGLALAVYTLSFGSLLKKDFKMYLFWVVLAMTFHRSVFFAIPMYFIFTRPNDLKQNILLFVIGLFCAIFLRDLIGVAAETVAEKYTAYMSWSASSGSNYAYFYMFLAVGFLFCKPFIAPEDRREYDTYLNMILLGGVLNIAVAYGNATSNLMRMSLYFLIAACYIWPILLRNLRVLYLPFISLQFLFFLYMSRKTSAIKFFHFNEWVAPMLGLD